MDETATLENVTTKAKQMEWSASEQGFMTGTSGSDRGTFGIKQSYKSQRVSEKSNQRDTQQRRKYSGKNQRHASKENCPAFGKSCKNCGKNNHFAAVCKQKKKPPGSCKVGALEVDYDSLNTLTSCISGHSQVAKMVDATIDGCNITSD